MSRNAKIVLLVILAIIFVAEAVAATVIVLHRSKNHSSGPADDNSQTAPISDNRACVIFTLGDAKQLLTGDASGGAMQVTGSSTDVQVSGCSYKLGNASNASATAAKSASLVVHKPKTSAGIAGNQKIFSGQLPGGAQAVSGYGEKAFWDPQLGQLNILKRNVWYVLAYGQATPSDRSLAQTKQLADILAPKL